MRKIQLILLGLITIICVIVKFNSDGSTSFSKGEDFAALNTPNSAGDADTETTDDANKSDEDDQVGADSSKPVPVVESMTYNAKSFTLNKSYDFSISLSEKNNKQNDRNYTVKVFAGSDPIGAGDLTIKKDEESANTSIPVKFTKPSSFRTNIKVYDKETNEKVLDKNGTTSREASNKITSPNELFGLDHFGAHDASVYQDFKKKGVSFVARYYSKNERKCITKSEAQDITNAGLQVVTVYQDSADSPDHFTRETGTNDGNRAIELAKSIGQPVSTPIYFAVDIEAKGQALDNVSNYFQGVNDAMNSYKEKNKEYWQVGVYGCYDVVSHIQGANLATYAWQTAGWSNGQVYSNNNIYQKDVNTSFMGIAVDKNYSNSSTNNDVGGFYIN